MSGRLSSVAVATVFAAASGYVVMMLAGRSLGPADFAVFAAFWASYFALAGVAGGMMAEVTRAVSASRPGSLHSSRLSTAAFLLAIGFMIVVAALYPVWSASQVGVGWWWSIPLLALSAGLYAVFAVVAGSFSGQNKWGLFSALLTVDAALRLIAAVLCTLWSTSVAGWFVVSVCGSVSWIVISLVLWVRRRGGPLAVTVDISVQGLLAGGGHAMVAAAAHSVLIVGMPVLISLTSHPHDSAARIGVAIAAVTMTRAPLLVPLTSFHSALIVRFVSSSNAAKDAAKLCAAVTVVGVLGAGAAWGVGPQLLRLMFGAEFVLSPAHLGGLTLAACPTAWMMIYGCLMLARSVHVAYAAGWWTVVACVCALLLWLPQELLTRVIVALAVGPLAGLIVYAVAAMRLGREQAVS